MATKKQKLAVTDLIPGMFVCELDRPWCQTPFPLQGFYVENTDDIPTIRRYCNYVYIDVPLSKGSYDHLFRTIAPVNADNQKKAGSQHKLKRRQRANTASKTSSQTISRHKIKTALQTSNNAKPFKPMSLSANATMKVAPIKIKSPVAYSTRLPMSRACKQAVKLMDDVEHQIHDLYQAVELNTRFDLQTTRNIAKGLVTNVTDNPDALVWLARMQNKDQHTYYHAVSASIWGLVLGRQLGLELGALETLATGLLLSQVGKTKLPDQLLVDADTLSARDYLHYQSYVMESVQLLKMDPAIGPQVISVVEHHRERHNGSGFPKGVTGEQIPLLGKIAGLVDRFQELIHPHAGANPMGPAQAMSVLFQSSNIEFQADLVERFVSAIGVYPTGSLVELNSGDIGIVVSPNEGRKLWPTVMLIRQDKRQQNRAGKLVNLMEYNEQQEDVGRYVQITKTLPQDSVSIDPKELIASTTPKWSLGNLF